MGIFSAVAIYLGCGLLALAYSIFQNDRNLTVCEVTRKEWLTLLVLALTWLPVVVWRVFVGIAEDRIEESQHVID